jgi:outer membrane protein assembly factor BamB
MGFLKKIFYILSLTTFILSGCIGSSIRLDFLKDNNPYPVFGKTNQRTFYFPLSVTASIKLKYDYSVSGSFANSSVVFHNQYLFVNDLSGRVYCYNTSTGKKIGHISYKGSIFTTPLIHRSWVIFANVHFNENLTSIIIYDFSRAELYKEIIVKGKVKTEMLLMSNGIIFTTEKGIIYRYDFLGEKLWQFDTKSTIRCSPAMLDNNIVVGNDNGEIIFINAGTGEILFRKKYESMFDTGIMVNRDNIFVGDHNGNLFCLNSDGSLKWNFQSGSRITMTPAADDSSIYFGNLKGKLFKLNIFDGKLIWTSGVDGILNITPAVTDNFLIVPDQNKQIHFVNKFTGEITENHSLDGRSKLTPVIKDSTLYIGYDNGNLEAYEFVR